ncbi:MAG: Ig-like domain-containing protein [bacterium]
MRETFTFKSLMGLLLFMTFWVTSSAQTNIYSSDFNDSQGEEFSTTGTIGSSSWAVNRSGDDWGARIHNNILEHTNTASSASNEAGWIFTHLDAEEFEAPFSPILGTNPQPVSWYFNMRQIRSNPAGFSSNSYGVAFVLGADNTDVADSGSGYAILLGNSGTPDPVRLVKFSGGIQSLGTTTESLITASDILEDPTNNYMSIGVSFDPETNTWELWGRLDGSDFEGPLEGDLTLLGSAVDNEFTSIPLNYTGAYWQGSTAANQTAFFDNVSVWLEGEGSLPPSITQVVQFPSENITPEESVSVSADVAPGDAPISSVALQWGLDDSSMDNTIVMSLETGQTFSTDEDIPAQPHNTSVFYRVQATDANDLTVFSSIFSYQVLDPDIDLIITSVEDPGVVTVDYGTAFEDLPLPEELDVMLDNEESISLSVDWSEEDYDELTAGFYTLQGELQLQEGIDNPDDIQPQIGVVVLEEIFMPENPIIGYTFPEEGEQGANMGTEGNVGNLIVREEGFDGSYSYPAGITGQSISTTGWSDGENSRYWMIQFSTLGFTDLLVSSAQRSSNTGPRDFKLQYRVAAGDWVDVTNTDITVANNFSSGVLLQVPLPEEMEEQVQVALRWIMTSNVSVNEGSVASTGTSRMDHLFVEGIESGFVPNVVSVENPEDLYVEQGTLFEQLNLPEEVAVTLSNNQVLNMDVMWDESGYDGDVIGENLLPGDLVVPPGITNDNDIHAEVTVFVEEEAEPFTIVSVHTIDQVIIVDEGTTFDALDLPAQVDVTLNNDSIIPLEVNWLEGDYNGNQPAVYQLEGEVVLVQGIENPDNLMASIMVEVLSDTQVYMVTFRVDMSNAPDFDPETDQVFITGSMFDNAIPGTLPDEQTMEPGDNLIYTNTMELEEGSYTYKYYRNAGIDNPEPGSDRSIEVLSDTIFDDYWGVTQLREITHNSINVYPNPASSHLEISSQGTIYECSFFDINGMKLMNQPVMNHRLRISLSDFPAGIYFLRLTTEHGLENRKIVISR